ncbi:hypothetical protein BD414DRAFT_501078 [Trametes punicea]|nr:hypothetical protein BD414DRAFT_501078 [Trametes punicea]
MQFGDPRTVASDTTERGVRCSMGDGSRGTPPSSLSSCGNSPSSQQGLHGLTLGEIFSSTSTAHTRSSRSRPSSSVPADSRPLRPPRRRIRPKIALDPNQPLTAQGKPRARVCVACNQCRVRKTRCDGARPNCFHCRKRPPENGEACCYEPQPKRRGQDREPGTRVRQPSKRRISRVDATDSDSSNYETSRSVSRSRSASRQVYETHGSLFEPLSDGSDSDPFAVDFEDLLNPFSIAVNFDAIPPSEDCQSIPARPSLQFTRETWWDALLAFYCSDDTTQPHHPTSLTTEQRSVTLRRIISDLRALFHSSFYWVSFINMPRFFDSVLDPVRRASLQPSVLLSALAAGVFAQSSEADNSAAGRARALKLIELADGALHASLASGWVDVSLVTAAWFIVYFEMQVHPLRSIERKRSSLLLLDSLMRLFSLTTLDADLRKSHSSTLLLTTSTVGLPTAMEASVPHFDDSLKHTSFGFDPILGRNTFLTTNIPSSARTPPCEPLIPDNITLGPSIAPLASRCNCAELTMSHNWPSVQELAPAWSATIAWPTSVSEGEMSKEECRRLVWATVILIATLNTYTCVFEDAQGTRLSIKDPRNYALMFPAESLAMAGTPVQANNVWTLYLRSMLLLQFCERVRTDPTISEADRAQFAMSAWLEIDAMDEALDQHTCGLESKSGYHAREMLFSARMCVSHEFQRYIPQITTCGSSIFYRHKAESWLKQRMDLAEHIWASMLAGRYVPTLDHRKPLLIYWFMSHVIKALRLWRADPTLTIALSASKTFVKCVEYLMVFWPSLEQRAEWQNLRYQLVDACLQAGIAPPEPSIPVPFPRKGAV